MDIDKTVRVYTAWAICLPAVLYLFCQPLGMGAYGLISAMFHILCSVAYIMGWRAMALRSPQMLPKYYLAGTALRLMAAAMVLLVFCVVSRADTGAVKGFALVFIVFYLVMLTFDAIFFAKVSNNKKVTK